jgi:MFS transporter, NNP family, nitrate/nitrite transporter
MSSYVTTLLISLYQLPKQEAGLFMSLLAFTGALVRPIGGFYLPVIMGIAKESTGSYQMGFATFGVLAALAFTLVMLHRARWLTWALPDESLADSNIGRAVASRLDLET